MGKRISRILSALLVCALVVSTAEVVHAEEVNEPVSGAVQLCEEELQEEPEGQALDTFAGTETEQVLDTKATVNGNIPVKMAETGTEALDAGIISYNSDNVKGNYCGYSQQVTFSAKGTLDMAVATGGSSSGTIYFGLFYDVNLTQPVDSYSSASKGNVSGRIFRVPAAGPYYLGLYSTKGTSYSYYASVAAVFYNGADRAITNGKQIVVGQKDAQTNYFKFTAVKNGYITVCGDESAGYYQAALCNGSKKALSGNTTLRYSPTYGVKKGTTYYIKVTSNSNTNGGYTLKVTNFQISEKSGSKKAKAVTIKKKATKKGTILAGSSQADWYKFKLTGNKAVKIYFSGHTNDQLKITVYRGSKKIGSSTLRYYDSSADLSSVGKLSKGTYYIKIQRVNSKSSGWYSLKWK